MENFPCAWFLSVLILLRTSLKDWHSKQAEVLRRCCRISFRKKRAVQMRGKIVPLRHTNGMRFGDMLDLCACVVQGPGGSIEIS